ncbi:hypothetical protein RGU39_20715 [Bacillus wiedmannii]|uniref:hypothetical protein n=1 Tax=Bacillus wiedmannii TaxID=1890302 RepID=UPI002852FF77|nr:hypothetical protein [Bacillus wiedmannii]MDR4942992.1 hypothetical protein [Bacillus wiedmannii]
MENVHKLESFVYAINSPNNGLEYWEIKLTNVRGIYYGGARCMNSATLYVDFRDLRTRDERTAINAVIDIIKDNLA